MGHITHLSKIAIIKSALRSHIHCTKYLDNVVEYILYKKTFKFFCRYSYRYVKLLSIHKSLTSFLKSLQFVELWKIKLMCSWIFSASLMARIHSSLAAGLERLVYRNLQGKASSKHQLPSRSAIPANSPTFCQSQPKNGTKTCHNLSPE